MKRFRLLVTTRGGHVYSHDEEADTTWTPEKYADRIRMGVNGSNTLQVQDTVYFTRNVISVRIVSLPSTS